LRYNDEIRQAVRYGESVRGTMNTRTARMTPSIKLLGLGFWQAWWMTAMCSDTLLPADSRGSGLFSNIVWVMLLTALGYLAVVLCSRRFEPFIRHPASYLITASAASVGSLGMALSSSIPDETISMAAFIVATVLFSLGNALLLIMWGELWSTLATGRVARSLFASYLFAFVLFFCIFLLPRVIAIPVLAAYPVISVIVLHMSRSEPRREPSAVHFEMEVTPHANLFLPILLISIVWGASQVVVTCFGVDDANLLPQSFLAAGLFLGAILTGIVIFPPDIEPLALYRVVVPSVVSGLILMALLPASLSFIGNGFVILGVYTLDMLIMLVSTDLAFRTRRSVVLFFGMSIFVARIGTVIGSLAIRGFCSLPLDTAGVAMPVYLIGALVVMLVGTLMFAQTDLLKLYRTRPVASSAETLDERCSRIAAKCGLTARESETLLLLAKGRSIPYIAQELTIATGTAKHHVSNIYRKIGVYDRQSLHDVIDQGDAGKGAE
jgi:DNA-binding CsgD family transcriptional regulator